MSFESNKSGKLRHTVLIAVAPVFIFSILLPACSSAVPLPTPTASPFPTVDAIPFDIPDLAPLLTEPFQRPARVTSADIDTVPHPSFAALPRADHFISALYSIGSEFGGRVSIFMYVQETDLDAAWPLVLDTIYTPREIPGPGELTAVDHSDLAFIRCNALVHIKLNGADPDEILIFAEKLDADLVPLVCP